MLKKLLCIILCIISVCGIFSGCRGGSPLSEVPTMPVELDPGSDKQDDAALQTTEKSDETTVSAGRNETTSEADNADGICIPERGLIMIFFYFLIGLIILIGIVLILQVIGVFKENDIKLRIPYYYEKNNSISDSIEVLDGSFDEHDKTDAILSLFHSAYFCVQTQGNEGNNYDDNAQSALFSQFLTPSAAKSLSNLEGRNGQYSF